MRTEWRTRPATALLAVVVAALFLVGCGSDGGGVAAEGAGDRADTADDAERGNTEGGSADDDRHLDITINGAEAEMSSVSCSRSGPPSDEIEFTAGGNGTTADGTEFDFEFTRWVDESIGVGDDVRIFFGDRDDGGYEVHKIFDNGTVAVGPERIELHDAPLEAAPGQGEDATVTFRFDC